MADAPFCSKCSRHHWRFRKCEEAPASGPLASHLAAPEGMRTWESQLDTIASRGDNVFMLSRKHPFPVGSLTYPPDTAPPEAAEKGTNGS